MATITVEKENPTGACIRDNGEGHVSRHSHADGRVDAWVPALLASLLFAAIVAGSVLFVRERGRARR